MSEKRNVPDLRFPEFLEPFERVSFGSLILNLDSGVSVNSESDKPAPHGKAGVMKTSCVSCGKFFPEENKLIVEEEIDRAKLSPKKGTIIISRMNTPALVGESGFVLDNFENLFLPDRLWLAVPNETVSDPKYLSITLTTPKTRSEISSIGTGTSGSMKNISKPNFLGLEILLPSLPEQQKIAEFLTAVDRRIELLQAKKEKLEAYKKGVMQKIFAQKIRFKADDGSDFSDWEERKLGELGKTFNGLTGKSKENFGQGKPYIQYKQIFDSSEIKTEGFGFVDVSENESQSKVQRGDVFFTTSSETPHEIGMASVLTHEVGDVYLNSFCFGFRPNSLDSFVPKFSRYFFRSPIVRSGIVKLAQGSTRYNMSKVELMRLTFEIPSSLEQVKIAKFLTSLDTSIENLNQQINHMQTWKKGLLQQMFV